MKQFIKEMLSNKDNISSKRLSGILLIVQFLLVIVLSFIIELNELTADLSETGLYAGIGLLGFSTVEKVWKK